MSASLLAEAGPRIRPNGIRNLAWGCFALAIYLVFNGLLVARGMVSFASGAYLLSGLETMGPAIYLLVACVLALLGFMLLRGWSIARRLAIIASALLLAGAMMPISSAVIYAHVFGIVIHGAKIIVAVMLIRYLLQPEVVDYFSAETGSPRT
jgi:hypothetical protein